jgi:Catalytic LigB subunit of aromatic ring-opening dioxygenase
MAQLCAAICMSHSPYLFASPEEWEHARQIRRLHGYIAEDVPVDSLEDNQDKHERCMKAIVTLRKTLEAARPDVIILFGDDQSEQFDFTNYPALEVYAGQDYSGYKISGKFGLPVPRLARKSRPKTEQHWATSRGHPQVARWLITRLMEEGFDLSFSLRLPKPEDGIGHAFMRPSFYLTPNYDVPTVPFFVNCYFGPQPTGRRCAELGRAVRRSIENMPIDLRVAVIGSGGLWHTPMTPQSMLDGEFDAAVLHAVKHGDADAMAAFFDSRRPEVDPHDGVAIRHASGGTHMVLGLGNGTGETRNWIIVAGVVDGTPGTVVDYVPVYASPVGLAFAQWSL